MKISKQGVFIATLFTVFCGWAQTNTIIKLPTVTADHNVKLNWNAEPGGVYSVESADSLTDVGPQGLQWVIRDNECPSKGTNAEWMDVGDPQWLPRFLQPALQPMRFYRVKKVGHASGAAPSVSVVLSQGGNQLPNGTNVIAGDLDIAVNTTLNDTNQMLSSVKLMVDGQRLYTVDNSFRVSINTSEWPNGPHEIYAVATAVNMGDIGDTTPGDDATADAITNAVQTAIGVATSNFCAFSNYISQFALTVPFFQIGQTQEVVAKFEADSFWRVTIVNNQDTEVRQFPGQGPSAYAAWDGNDDNGSPISYGYYDYIVEARPSQYGPLVTIAQQAQVLNEEASTNLAGYQRRTAPYKLTAAAMQFSRSNTLPENIIIPSLNPANTSISTNDTGEIPSIPNAMLKAMGCPTTAEEALAQGFSSFFVQPPPMPPIITKVNGVFHVTSWEEVYGPQAAIEIQIPSDQQIEFMASGALSLMDAGQAAGWPDQNYTTRSPDRSPGNHFYGFVGSVGIGYQGHHPSRPPVFGSAPGGVLASVPPWGPLITASSLANNFSINMGYAGWRTSFLLGDDNLNSLALSPIGGPNTGTGTFATQCHLGLVVGHMTASQHNDPNYYATVPYVPIYNSAQPGHLQWIALPNMDLGNGNIYSKLKWMCFYGCQSLKERDYTDLWSKWLLPMPPNLRLILGSEDGVFIVPNFGTRFAENLNGWTTSDSSPMTIFDAWCDAASDADNRMSHQGWYKLGWPIGTRRMTAIYRDNSQSGSWKTINDSIWGWWSDISYDWTDVTFTVRQVY